MDNSCIDKDNWFVEFLINKKYRLYRHLLIWAYILVMMYDPNEQKEFSGMYHFYNKTLTIFYFMFMLYINMYVLVPKLLFKNKFVNYLLSIFVMTIVFHLTLRFVKDVYFNPYRILPDRTYSSVYREVLGASNVLTLLVFSSTAIKLFQQWAYNNNRINELEKNSHEIELRELKNQVNPHFLFNMLNNVNVLVKKDTDKASRVIMKLSDFLRHLLYQNKNESVALVSEIQFINDFLELEKIRRDDFTFTMELLQEEARNVMLPPNLFLTFVENAVKHSVDLDNPSQIDIAFAVINNELVFTCGNTKPEDPVVANEEGGLGLVNIKRQLELLYGNGFSLLISNEAAHYNVILTLPV